MTAAGPGEIHDGRRQRSHRRRDRGGELGVSADRSGIGRPGPTRSGASRIRRSTVARLFAGVGHGVLFFSLSTESPYTLVGGTVYHRADGRFLVRGLPDRDGLGETDSPDAAFRLLADNIPADAGPVVVGRGVPPGPPKR
ncbi:DUF6193 family natural product biosynthesis protein [Streptomyces sp. NPDC006798]|uniref:DUF6193 family natural product biosynthesis protein n=1 Tax=Streptomyces sp. NPDC006798 TaxID=3155462 RepID=UPI0033D987BD